MALWQAPGFEAGPAIERRALHKVAGSPHIGAKASVQRPPSGEAEARAGKRMISPGACLRFGFGLVLAAAVACGSGRAGAADIAGSKDHPLVGRYDGAEIVGYAASDYDEAKVLDAPFAPVDTETRTGAGFTTLEGKTFLIYYALPAGRSTLEVLRNYQAALKAKGFGVLFSCAAADGSCFASKAPDAAYFLGSSIGDPLTLPRLADDYVHNWFEQNARYVLARLDRPEGAVYAAIWLGESGRGSVAVVRVVETAQMEADKIVFVDAGEMQQAIESDGRISLYGILFDFDKDVLRPESKPTLDEIARLMASNTKLNLQIVGHTDNQGSTDYNMDLSRRRAAAVVAALTRDYGVGVERLTAEGAGSSAPVASNDDEQGRAKNRRVGLVSR